jgi:alkylation response protein AidB-like acyl-CoA dehydrogenase
MSPDLSLLPSEVALDLRATVRDLLGDRCPPEAVIACGDGDRSVVAPLWRAVATDLGLAGLLVPEELGGHGAGHREVAVVAEELGARAAPVPFLTSAVLATSVLLAAGTEPAQALLRRLAVGEVTAALVVPWSTHATTWVPAGGGRVCARSVAGALEADVLLVPVAVDGGVEVRAVSAGADGVDVAPVVSLDMTRQLADVEVDLERATGELVAGVGRGGTAVRQGLRAVTAALAAEQAALARAALTATVAYLGERRQFGRVVGGFQALKHRMADLYVEAESADAVATWAAATLADVADEDERDLAVAVAAAYCSDAAVHATEEQVQLHGGIAMTWEHPAHLLLKRAKADQLALGGPERHRGVVAQLADLASA